MSTTTVVETTTEEPEVTGQSPVNQLDEQQDQRVVYDNNGTPRIVDAQGFEVVDVASTNLQGNLQQIGGCFLEGNVTPTQSEGDLAQFGEAHHYAQTMVDPGTQSVIAMQVPGAIQYYQYAPDSMQGPDPSLAGASDLDQRILQPIQNVTSGNANVHR